MKNKHIAAFAFFAIAALLYYFSTTKEIATGFAGFGLIFELAGWKNLFSRAEK